jgi:NAD(P)-dependent dehydrogenase (short-subunit alcohol dehydrogenase family)
MHTARTILIVGASRGIGLALARQLHARGDRVIATTRGPSPELAAVGVQVIDGVDIRLDEGVLRLSTALGQRQLDDVVIVAGILEPVDLGHLDLERIREQLEVNALGPLRIAHALVERLHPGSRLAFLTSRMGSIGDNTSGGHYGYRMSKAALNMAGKSLAIDLAPRGIAVRLLHPGFVKTEMTGGQGQLTAEASARLLIERLDELTVATTGQLVHASGEQLPW